MNRDETKPWTFAAAACVLAVAALSAATLGFRLGDWPWDHDEVATLVEMGLVPLESASNQSSQYHRLPRLVPVWYGLQRATLQVAPVDEFGTRLLSCGCGVLLVVFLFVVAWRWSDWHYAAALVLLVNFNRTFIWLVQQNRFYSMGLLFYAVTAAAVLWPGPRRAVPLVCVMMAGLLGVLSHNLMVVVFGIWLIAAAMCWPLGWVSRDRLGRVAVAAFVGGIVYAAYLRPIMAGWISGDTGGTNELVSFVAQLGAPTAGLAFFGAVVCLLNAEPRLRALGAWCGVALGGGVMFVALSPLLLKNWNPRYAIFFMPPFWLLAAAGVADITRRLTGFSRVAALHAAVLCLLLPGVASYFVDGSRHDFRAAAELVTRHRGADEQVLCNWPLTMKYYLDPTAAPKVVDWWKGGELPSASCLVVYASNIYEPVLQLPDRRVTVIGQIAARRLDEQSHLIRVYHLSGRNEAAAQSVEAP